MAEGAAQFLITKIYTLLENEASFLGGVRQEFDGISRELVRMKAFLRDAETWKHSISEVVKIQVKEVTDSVYDVEDIIAEFMYYIGSRRRQNQGFKGFIKKTAKLPKTTWLKHKYGTELQIIRAKLKDISERSNDYRFDHNQDDAASMTSLCDPSGHVQLQEEREVSRFLGDNEIVGVEEDCKVLSKWLLDKEEPQRTLISVVGMGGSGKTTLVSKVYKSVKRHFDCYAWVTVSQSFVVEDLCRKMIKGLRKSPEDEVSRDPMSTMKLPDLVDTLVELLQRNRYLVVLDDVWGTDVWRKLRVALPDAGCGSRVLLTTRVERVASDSFGDVYHVHRILPLKEHEAWSLFCQKAFPNDQMIRRLHPPELMEAASLIVQKCEGLPLVLVSMGGLMSTKERLPSEWMNVYNSMNWLLGNDKNLNTVKAILFLSYNDLPYHLKHCFLYCSVFPEDYEIKRSRLIRLWVAEGFIEEGQGKTLEDVAGTYVEELISRCLLQVVMDCYGRMKTLRMHDVIRELAISTAREQNLCNVSSCDQQGKARRDWYRDPRRLSLLLDHGVAVDAQSLGDISRLRSLLMFVQQSGNISPFSPTSPSTSSMNLLLPRGFRLLRVLDLEDAPVTCLPGKEFGNMFNLHYLSLRRTQVALLPNSIGKLHSLQTLDIKGSRVGVLPDGIVNCQNLQHLLAGYELEEPESCSYLPVKGVEVPSDIWKLKNLQVLTEIESRPDGCTNFIKGIGSMTQLRRLQITQVRQGDVKEWCAAIQQLRLLRRLDVEMSNEFETLQTIDHVTDPPPHLRKLVLSGKLDKIPLWVSSLNSLTSLELNYSQLREEEDPLLHISNLPCLKSLDLCNAYDGQRLCFQKESLPNLEKLSLMICPRMNELVFEQGASPNLQEFTIQDCRELKEVPHGIQNLAKLREVTLISVSEELVNRLRPGGADAPKVGHILEIYYQFGDQLWENLTSSTHVESQTNT